MHLLMLYPTMCVEPHCPVPPCLPSAAGTKSAVDGVKKGAESIGNIGKNVTGAKSAAGYHAPAVGVFAAAGFGSLLLLAL